MPASAVPTPGSAALLDRTLASVHVPLQEHLQGLRAPASASIPPEEHLKGLQGRKHLRT
jgi:hypothetical protein